MTVAIYTYPHAIDQAFNGEHDFGSFDYYAMLLGSYTPNDAHAYVSDVVASEKPTANGYTAGGVLLGSKSINFVDDTSGTIIWAVATAYATGAVVRPTAANGHIYVCVDPGTSHASAAPTWPTESRKTVADNDIIWAEAGRAFVWFDCGNPQWTATGLLSGVRYAVIANRTPATNATRPLLALVDLGADAQAQDGLFELQISGLGLFRGFPSFPF